VVVGPEEPRESKRVLEMPTVVGPVRAFNQIATKETSFDLSLCLSTENIHKKLPDPGSLQKRVALTLKRALVCPGMPWEPGPDHYFRRCEWLLFSLSDCRRLVPAYPVDRHCHQDSTHALSVTYRHSTFHCSKFQST
jgi:hypothetical protein